MNTIHATAITILSLLGIALLITFVILVTRLIRTIILWKETCSIQKETIEIQKGTIERYKSIIEKQEATMESYKKLLSNGIVVPIDDKVRAN